MLSVTFVESFRFSESEAGEEFMVTELVSAIGSHASAFKKYSKDRSQSHNETLNHGPDRNFIIIFLQIFVSF